MLFPRSVGLSLEVTLRKDYPNEIPDLMVRPLKGVTSKQAKELLEKLVEQARELVGMQMLYPLAQYLKDWLDEQNKDNLSKQKDAAKAKEELEIEKEKEVRASFPCAHSNHSTLNSKPLSIQLDNRFGVHSSVTLSELGGENSNRKPRQTVI